MSTQQKIKTYELNLVGMKAFLLDFYVQLVAFISGVGLFGSLGFSEIMKLTPCDLCWYQRILFYPIFPLSIIALLRKDKSNFVYYVLPLSIPGALLALYHYLLQLTQAEGGSNAFIPCDPSNPCGQVDFILFEFLTIPLMSFVGFMVINILLVAVLKLYSSPAKR